MAKKMKEVRIIIPTLKKNKEEVREILENQTFQDYNLKVVEGVRPPAKARNLGAQGGQEEILIFIDDDVKLGCLDIIEKTTNFLRGNQGVGAVGVGVKIPPDSTWFQKRAALEIPRFELLIPLKDTETKEDITGSFFGVKRKVFEVAGRFNEDLVSGEDPEFFYRLIKKGYKNFVLGQCFIYHAPPANLKGLVKKFFWYGIGHYQSRHLHPEWQISIRISNFFTALLYLIFRTLFFVPHIFLGDVSFRNRRIKFSFKPLRAIASYAAALGYFWGFLKDKVKKKR